MGWTVSTFDNKYQIKYGSNSSYLITEDDVSYLTITDTKHIGINNEYPDPEYLVDINGETHINSNLYITGNQYISNSEYINSNLYVSRNVHVGSTLYTSNIIGVGVNNSNNIKINYTSPIFMNNSTQIYGNTSFIGRVSLVEDTSNDAPLIDIKGALRASRIYGEGCNIYNINASNVRLGILETSFGGTGVNRIVPNAVLYGGLNNNLLQTPETLRYENNTLKAPIFAGSLNGDDIKSGIVKVSRGGTGITSVQNGRILFGNPDETKPLLSSPDLVFDAENRILEINTLKLGNSNIYLLDTSNILRKFHYNDLGIFTANSMKEGLILPSDRDFYTSNGILNVRKEVNAVWMVNEDTGGSNIYFPDDFRIDSAPQIMCSMGVNTRYPEYALDVKGDINTIGGNYRVDGIDINRVVINYAMSNLLIDNLSGIRVAAMKRYVPTSEAEREISNREGIWRINNTSNNDNESTSVEVTNLIATKSVYLSSMILNNTDDRNAIPFLDSSKYIFKIQDKGANILKFSKIGNLLVGNNNTESEFDIPPTQRLEVVGNIHATGYIRSYYSDDRLKTFTSNITGALNIIDSLKGFHYVPNDKALQLGFTYDNEIGLSAQDVQKVVPEIVKIAPFDSTKDIESGNIVSKSGEDYLTICYERLGAVFVEAIKELRQENKKLKDEIVSIKKDLDNIKNIIYIQ
jgi:hypothetical protein